MSWKSVLTTHEFWAGVPFGAVIVAALIIAACWLRNSDRSKECIASFFDLVADIPWGVVLLIVLVALVAMGKRKGMMFVQSPLPLDSLA